MEPRAALVPDLRELYARVNAQYFDSFMDPPVLRWNARLRTSAGRFIPGSRRLWQQVPPIIEVATYLQDEPDAVNLIVDTVAHEMIHYWLWIRRRPYGHTPEFLEKMRSMGVSRYNPVPRRRPYRYLYRCGSCQHAIPSRKRLGAMACARCCKKFARGRYDARFGLVFERELAADEASVLPALP